MNKKKKLTTEEKIKLKIKNEKKKLKKYKQKEKFREQYPNRSDYRLFLSIKPIGGIHNLYHSFVKFLGYADKGGTVYQFVQKKLKEKKGNEKNEK